MLDDKKNMTILDNVIPQLCAFMTMRNMLRIQRQKADDEVKEQERQKRKAVLMAETGISFDEVEEPEVETKDTKNKSKSKKKQEEIDPAELERQKQAALKAKDIATYGRTWIWEDYHEEKEEINQIWLDGTAGISRINTQVLEDIEDWIILRAYKGTTMSHKDIQEAIDKCLTQQRERARMHQIEAEAQIVPDETNSLIKPVDVIEEGKVEDSKRKFMVPLRPHQRIWNFEYDDEKQRPKHVLRPDADPTKCYIDGRVEKLMEQVDAISHFLKTFNKERWDKLNNFTLDIFKAHEKDEEKAYAAFESSQNQ